MTLKAAMENLLHGAPPMDLAWPIDELVRSGEQARPGEPYGRKVLHRDAHREVLLMYWRGGVWCAPHDHASATGRALVLRGRFRERRWRFDGAALHLLHEQTVDSPSMLSISLGDIHDMCSEDDGGVSLHVYRPGISRMRVFDRDRRESLVVSDDCGAWIPHDSRQVMARERWR
jgi:hypothetical protein